MKHYGHKLSRGDKRIPLFREQRKERGFDDSETWSLDYTIAKFILPRLKRLNELKEGYPGGYETINGVEQWNTIMEKMISAFEYLADDNRDPNDADKPEVVEGLDLFAKFFRQLWW